jgi:hypothetical protein
MSKTSPQVRFKKIEKLMIALVFLVLVFAPFCGKKKEQETSTGPSKPWEKKPKIPEIVEVQIEPAKPSSRHILRALPMLKNPSMRGVKYEYTWFVNGERNPRQVTKLLPTRAFKKDDRVYCKVVAARGKYQSKEVESEPVEIGNSPPVIKFTPISPFEVPGRFSHFISATDPDGDDMTFRLIKPQDIGIEIDPETGEITWDIAEVPEDPRYSSKTGSPEDESGESEGSGSRSRSDNKSRLSPIVKIVYEVRDSDDAAATGSIILNLKKGREARR